MDAGEIIKNGGIELILVVSGMRQRQRFNAVREQTALGSVPFLVPRKELPLNALIHACEETGLPVKWGQQRLFPKGRGMKDFVGL